MSTRLVILGLLRVQPLHGYEIKHIIEEHMGDWISIAFGSIYFALGKLSEEGLIEMVATEKAGNRPSRSVYQITEAGRAEFLGILREVWREPERQYFSIDVGLVFMNALPAEGNPARVSELDQCSVHPA
jgi:DNA-binding PadR family transcriptional regulator